MEKKISLGTKKNAYVGGVCSGLSDYFKVDVAIIRLVFCLSLLTSVGGFAYIACWISFPKHPSEQDKD